MFSRAIDVAKTYTRESYLSLLETCLGISFYAFIYVFLWYSTHIQKLYMKIGINASFLRKSETGIGQVTLHSIKELLRLHGNSPMFSDHEFVLYTQEPLPDSLRLAGNFTAQSFLPPYTRDDLARQYWWEKFTLPSRVSQDKCHAFISLYQCPTVLPKSVRHTMVAHDIIPHLFPEYLNNSRKRFVWKQIVRGLRSASAIVSVSRRTEKDLIQHLSLDPAKIHTAYIDIDPLFRKPVSDGLSVEAMKRYGLKPGYIYFGGGLDIRKNVSNLLRAYKLLIEEAKRNASRKPGFLVISGGLFPQLKPLISDVEAESRALNLSPFVKILGTIPQRLLPALYRNASVFIYPSKYEGFGMPPCEASCVGIPVVASRKGSLPEIGKDAWLYFDPERPREMATTVQNVLNSSRLREVMVRRGKERCNHFSWESFVSRVIHQTTIV